MRILSVVLAFFLAALAVWLTPQHLITAGLMDASLTSHTALTRHVAELEVAAARVIFAALAAALAIGAVFWPKIAASRPYRRLMEKPIAMPPGQDRALRQWRDPEALILAGALVVLLVYLAIGARFIPANALWVFNKEDGVLETVPVFFLLGASVLSALIALRIGRGHPRFACHLVLALLFFMMAGEEISWGQRIFGFGTPEVMKEVNVQSETNLHNMFGYLFDHLFILGFLTWAALIPLAWHLSATARRVLLRLGLPVPSAGLAVAMTLSGLMLDPLVYAVIDPMPTLRLAEIREFLSEFAFLLMMVQAARQFRQFRQFGAGGLAVTT